MQTTFNASIVPSTVPTSVAQKQANGFYKVVGDITQQDHYKVANRSAPILQQISAIDVPGIRAVSDTLVFVPEKSLTEKNQAVFQNRASYLDRHALGDLSNTANQIIAMSQQEQDAKPCVRIDPCPDPPFKELTCCANADPSRDDPAVPLLAPNEQPPYAPYPIRNYNFRDSTWGFMLDPERPWDRIALMIMGIAVGAGILAILALLLWAMIKGTARQAASAVQGAAAAFVPSGGPSPPPMVFQNRL